jgi:hypothetical protein
MANAKKQVVKSAAVENKINSAMSTLSDAGVACQKAVTSRSADAKKLTNAARRLSKKRATLMKRKKTAAARLKKTPNAENRKAASAVAKELAATTKELTKARALKQANAAELSGLKASLKRVNTYAKVLDKADKELNKPKKKRRKKRVKKAA